MSIKEYILSHIDTPPPAPPTVLKFTVSHYSNSLHAVNHKDIWKPVAKKNTFLGGIMNEELEYAYNCNYKDKSSSMMEDRVINYTLKLVNMAIRTAFQAVSYNKAPRMTNAYKVLLRTLPNRYANREIYEAKSDMLIDYIKILEYMHKTEVDSGLSIKAKENDVHRKNIVGLFALMEKRYYGKKNS